MSPPRNSLYLATSEGDEGDVRPVDNLLKVEMAVLRDSCEGTGTVCPSSKSVVGVEHSVLRQRSTTLLS
jgi:hypothetical protein